MSADLAGTTNGGPHGPRRLVRHVRGDGNLDQLAVVSQTPEVSLSAASEDPALVPAVSNPETMAELHRKLLWRYAHADALTEPAKVAVTTLGRRWREDHEAAGWMPDHPDTTKSAGGLGFVRTERVEADAKTPSAVRSGRRLDARPGSPEAVERGLAYHLACELTDLDQLQSREALVAQISAMKESGWIDESQFQLLDVDLLWAWWDSELGRRVRNCAGRVQREMPFTLRLEARDRERLAALANGGESFESVVAGGSDRVTESDFQVVQGVVDLAVIGDEAIWIVDYKTDQVDPSEVESKAEHYRFQLQLYAHALSGIYRRPVTEGWLFFIHARRSVRVV